jgi:hypothetical protein
VPRTYSHKFLVELNRDDPEKNSSLGVRLGRLCVNGNIPATYVASALDTTRVTIYGWFRGQGVREKKRVDVDAMISLMEQDFEAGLLPVDSHAKAKAYIERLIGRPI